MNVRGSAVVAAVALLVSACSAGPADSSRPSTENATSASEEANEVPPATEAPETSAAPDPENPLVTEILSGEMSAARIADVELSLIEETDCDVFRAWYEQYAGDSNIRVARQAYSECRVMAPSVGVEIARAAVDPKAALQHLLVSQLETTEDDEAVAHAMRLADSACSFLRTDPDVEAVARLHWEAGDAGVPEGTTASFVLVARRHLCPDVEIEPTSAPSTGAPDLSPAQLEGECASGLLESCDLFFAVSPLWSEEAEWAQTCNGARDVPDMPLPCDPSSQVPVVFLINWLG